LKLAHYEYKRLQPSEPAAPTLAITSPNFGQITGANAKSTLHRQFQAQLRFTFWEEFEGIRGTLIDSDSLFS
jgi:hypothetical protein